MNPRGPVMKMPRRGPLPLVGLKIIGPRKPTAKAHAPTMRPYRSAALSMGRVLDATRKNERAGHGSEAGRWQSLRGRGREQGYRLGQQGRWDSERRPTLR